MKKTKVVVFVFLALTALTLQTGLRIWRPDVQSINSCPLCLGVTSAIQLVRRGKAAEVRPTLARVVYITASRICECSQEFCVRGDQLMDQIFVGERKRLLRIIDMSKDLQAAEPYVGKLNLAFQLPAVIFVDSKDQILWHTGGAFSREAIIKKLGEFGV